MMNAGLKGLNEVRTSGKRGRPRKKAELLTHEEELYYLRRAGNGDGEAMDVLVRRNIGLVGKVAQKYTRRALLAGMDFDDLMQEGKIGLIRAIRKFDCGSGFRLSTYSVWWIRQAIDRAVMNSGIIRIPIHEDIRMRKFAIKKRKTEAGGEEDASFEKIARNAGFTGERARNLKSALNTRRCSSLEGTVARTDGLDRKLERKDLVEDTSPTPEEEAHRESRGLVLAEILSELSENERTVLKRRFGTANCGEMETLETVGKVLGLTRERVRQIEVRALDRALKIAKKKGLTIGDI